MNEKQLENFIFNSSIPFLERAKAVFKFQYEALPVYKQFCDLLDKRVENFTTLSDFPFLPIELFKHHNLIAENYHAEAVFRSSGTTGQVNSQHFVANLSLYERSILNGFKEVYGEISDYCIIGLLPSYLERNDASLVYMVNYLMKQSNHPENGFYLNNLSELQVKLNQLIQQNQPTILIGVTFALLDFAEQHPMDLSKIIVIETGGMKGRRKELTRNQLHSKLNSAFQTSHIHSEYGMTELLSQSYFRETGKFMPSSTMRVLTREINDPFASVDYGETGALNIIDLANLYSCSFIATQDLGKVYQNYSFDVLGRLSNADIRGCNLMVV